MHEKLLNCSVDSSYQESSVIGNDEVMEQDDNQDLLDYQILTDNFFESSSSPEYSPPKKRFVFYFIVYSLVKF